MHIKQLRSFMLVIGIFLGFIFLILFLIQSQKILTNITSGTFVERTIKTTNASIKFYEPKKIANVDVIAGKITNINKK